MGWKFNPFTAKLDVFVGPPTGPAGGDLAGTYPNPTVDGLQGTPVSNTAPTNGQVLQYNGTSWIPSTTTPASASYVVMSSDGTLTNERVLTQGTNIAITDGGANNPVTVATVLDPTFDSVQIDTTPSVPVTPAVGKIAWNDTDGTLEFGLKGGNVDLQIGQENILLVKNDQGAPLAKGEVVYISGGNGTNLLVKKAQANSDTTSASTIGLVAEPLAINGQGFITTFGVIKNVNTNAFNDGDILYLSPTTPGAVTNVKPSAPNHLVLVGFVQKKSAGAGEIFVEIQNGYELEELHNVQINSGTLANNDLLAYNSATLTWQNKTIASAGGITSVAGTSPISASTVAGTTTISTSMNTARLLGRTTAGVGAAEEITVGTGLSLTGGTLTNTAAGVTSVTATAPITSSGGATPDISTSIATNKVVGRSTAGTGVMEQLTPVGITVSGGNITGIGGTVGTVDNAVPRADGTGGFTVQGSDIVIDDATTSTANNVAITNQHAGQTNSSLVLTPKGTGALIAGPKPDGTATGGNARGSRAVDLQLERTAATQVASAANAFVVGVSNTVSTPSGMAIGSSNSVTGATGSGAFGTSNTASGGSFPCFAFGTSNTASGISSIAMGRNCSAGSYSISAGGFSSASGLGCAAFGNSALASGTNSQAFGESCTASANYSQAIGNFSLANRHGMFAGAGGSFSGTVTGDAQRARFVLRCKTTTNAAVEMALDGGTTYLGIPSGKVMSCLINISGVKSDGSAVAHYVRQYAVKNVGGTSSEVYAPVTIGTDNAAGTVIALSANNADDTLRIAVTGIAAETWRWVASVDAVEIAYGT